MGSFFYLKTSQGFKVFRKVSGQLSAQKAFLKREAFFICDG